MKTSTRLLAFIMLVLMLFGMLTSCLEPSYTNNVQGSETTNEEQTATELFPLNGNSSPNQSETTSTTNENNQTTTDSLDVPQTSDTPDNSTDINVDVDMDVDVNVNVNNGTGTSTDSSTNTDTVTDIIIIRCLSTVRISQAI